MLGMAEERQTRYIQPAKHALLWTVLLQLCVLWLLCTLQTVSRAQASDSSASDGVAATDTDEASSAAPAAADRYVFYPTHQPSTASSSLSLNYSLVPFNFKLGLHRITGRVLTVHSPLQSYFSVYPPPSGCGGGRSTVSESAKHWGCDVAMNAGFFQIDQPAAFCLNAVVSDGRLLQEQAQYPTQPTHAEPRGAAEVETAERQARHGQSDVSSSLGLASTGEELRLQPKAFSPISQLRSVSPSVPATAAAAAAAALSTVDPNLFAHHNVHFGVTSDGRYFVGHVNHSLLVQHSVPSADTWHFVQLLSGVVWLLRDGRPHVQQSWQQEEDRSTPIPAASFPTVVSARTAIGHDSRGRLMFVLVEGKTSSSGVGLDELAQLCLRAGMVNAINTDGGGSATLVEHGVLVNEPSESSCANVGFDGQTCERPVATIACLHPSRRDWTGTSTTSSASSTWQQQTGTTLSLGSCGQTATIRWIEQRTTTTAVLAAHSSCCASTDSPSNARVYAVLVCGAVSV